MGNFIVLLLFLVVSLFATLIALSFLQMLGLYKKPLTVKSLKKDRFFWLLYVAIILMFITLPILLKIGVIK